MCINVSNMKLPRIIYYSKCEIGAFSLLVCSKVFTEIRHHRTIAGLEFAWQLLRNYELFLLGRCRWYQIRSSWYRFGLMMKLLLEYR